MSNSVRSAPRNVSKVHEVSWDTVIISVFLLLTTVDFEYKMWFLPNRPTMYHHIIRIQCHIKYKVLYCKIPQGMRTVVFLHDRYDCHFIGDFKSSLVLANLGPTHNHHTHSRPPHAMCTLKSCSLKCRLIFRLASTSV